MSAGRWVRCALGIAGFGLAGCMEYSAGDLAQSPQELDDEPAPALIRIDVLPSQALDADGEFRVLSRTFGPREILGETDLGTLQLSGPVEIRGQVVGETVTPHASGGELPHVVEPVAAEVTIRRSGSVQQYVTRTDELGRFGSIIVPQDTYDLSIVPDDPAVPAYTQRLRVGQQPSFQDVFLDYGAAIWGRVVDAYGSPLTQVAVYVVDEDGVQSQPTYTDADGRYVLRVAPHGEYEVVAAGRASGREPQLTTPSVPVDDFGAEVDFVYENLSPVFRSGTVTDKHGAPLDDVIVRYTSEQLDGYADGTARLVVQTATFNGNFDVRLIAGTYQVELLPPTADNPADDRSPLLLTDQVLEGSPEVGPLVLAPFVEVGGIVHAAETPVPEARVSCQEEGFGQRTWSTYADADGLYSLQLPQVPVTCSVTPPGTRRLDLALTRTSFDAGAVGGFQNLTLVRGTRLTGKVETQGGGEPHAVVEVRTSAGQLLGSTLTEEDGYFELRVHLPY